jgi:hypothetical protein
MLIWVYLWFKIKGEVIMHNTLKILEELFKIEIGPYLPIKFVCLG